MRSYNKQFEYYSTTQTTSGMLMKSGTGTRFKGTIIIDEKVENSELGILSERDAIIYSNKSVPADISGIITYDGVDYRVTGIERVGIHSEFEVKKND